MKLPTFHGNSFSNGSSGSTSSAVFGIAGLKACAAAGMYSVVSLLSHGAFTVLSLTSLCLLLASLASYAYFRPVVAGRGCDVRYWTRIAVSGLLFYLHWAFFVSGLSHLGAVRTLIFSESLFYVYSTVYFALWKGLPIFFLLLLGLLPH